MMRHVSLFVFVMLFGCLFCCGAGWGGEIKIKCKVVDSQKKELIKRIYLEKRESKDDSWKIVPHDFVGDEGAVEGDLGLVISPTVEVRITSGGYQPRIIRVSGSRSSKAVKTISMNPYRPDLLSRWYKGVKPGVMFSVEDALAKKPITEFRIYIADQEYDEQLKDNPLDLDRYQLVNHKSDFMKKQYFAEVPEESAKFTHIVIQADGYEPLHKRLKCSTKQFPVQRFRLKQTLQEKNNALLKYGGTGYALAGKITDSVTGDPVGDARMLLVYSMDYFSDGPYYPISSSFSSRLTIDVNGDYLYESGHSRSIRHYLCVIADGYEPYVSDGLGYPVPELRMYDVELQPITGDRVVRVVESNGQPAVNASVYVVNQTILKPQVMDDGELTVPNYVAVYQANDKGECEIPYLKYDEYLIFVSESGGRIFDVTDSKLRDEFKLSSYKKRQLMVKGVPWKVVEGRMQGVTISLMKQWDSITQGSWLTQIDMPFVENGILKLPPNAIKNTILHGYLNVDCFDKQKHQVTFWDTRLEFDDAGHCRLNLKESNYQIKGVLGDVRMGKIHQGWVQKEASLRGVFDNQAFYEEYMNDEMQSEYELLSEIENPAERFAEEVSLLKDAVLTTMGRRTSQISSELARRIKSSFVVGSNGEFYGYVPTAGDYELKIVLENEAGEVKEYVQEIEVTKERELDLGVIWFDKHEKAEISESDMKTQNEEVEPAASK